MRKFYLFICFHLCNISVATNVNFFEYIEEEPPKYWSEFDYGKPLFFGEGEKNDNEILKTCSTETAISKAELNAHTSTPGLAETLSWQNQPMQQNSCGDQQTISTTNPAPKTPDLADLLVSDENFSLPMPCNTAVIPASNTLLFSPSSASFNCFNYPGQPLLSSNTQISQCEQTCTGWVSTTDEVSSESKEKINSFSEIKTRSPMFYAFMHTAFQGNNGATILAGRKIYIADLTLWIDKAYDYDYSNNRRRATSNQLENRKRTLNTYLKQGTNLNTTDLVEIHKDWRGRFDELIDYFTDEK